MKNVIAVVGSIIIVAGCVWGIYKQIDNFNKKQAEMGTAYTITVTDSVIV